MDVAQHSKSNVPQLRSTTRGLKWSQKPRPTSPKLLFHPLTRGLKKEPEMHDPDRLPTSWEHIIHRNLVIKIAAIYTNHLSTHSSIYFNGVKYWQQIVRYQHRALVSPGISSSIHLWLTNILVNLGTFLSFHVNEDINCKDVDGVEVVPNGRDDLHFVYITTL